MFIENEVDDTFGDSPRQKGTGDDLDPIDERAYEDNAAEKFRKDAEAVLKDSRLIARDQQTLARIDEHEKSED